MAPQVNDLDRLASRILGGLNSLLGVTYSDKFDPFIYPVKITSAVGQAINTTQSGSISISQDSAFFCTHVFATTRVTSTGQLVTLANLNGIYTSGTVGLGDNGYPDVPYAVQVTDGGKDRLMHADVVDFAAVYGVTAMGGGGKLARPKFFRPNSTVTIAVSNLKAPQAALSFDLRFNLFGFKVYNVAALDVTSRVQTG